MVFSLIYAASLVVILMLQYFLPPLPWFEGGRVLLFHSALIFAPFAFPYPLALLFLCGGSVLWDCATLPLVSGTAELPVGWTAAFFGVVGSACSPLRPLFLKGHWEIYCLAAGLVTALYVLVEFAALTLLRQSGIELPRDAGWRIFGAGIMAILAAPVYYVAMMRIGATVGFSLRLDDDPYR